MAVVGGTPPSDDDRHCYAVFAPVLPTPPVPRCRPQRHTECDDCAMPPMRAPPPAAIRDSGCAPHVCAPRIAFVLIVSNNGVFARGDAIEARTWIGDAHPYCICLWMCLGTCFDVSLRAKKPRCVLQ